MVLPKDSVVFAVICAGFLLFPISSDAQEVKWRSLVAEVDVRKDAHAGEWRKGKGVLEVSATERARITLPVTPKGDYDFRVSFTRYSGSDSIALIFPMGGKQACFEVDAWGENLAGIQNIDGKSIRENPTRTTKMRLRNGQRYTIAVEVRKGEVRGLLDGKVIAAHKTDGKDLSVVDLWEIPQTDQLGLGAWKSATTFHTIEYRERIAADEGAPSKESAKSAPDTMQSKGKLTGKRVLIIIANKDFYYREYADPREELQKAGAIVTVAAGRKERCTPHRDSGEGPDGGVVMPDLALDRVRTSDYDAVLFSGGWGASSYQYAFDGRYDDPAYNGDRGIKTAANKVINEFLKADKYVAALCNGVSVLAWARVDGKSPLKGKKVCAPVREAAAGIYNGRQSQPSCRWHPEVNGAVLSPPGAIGKPETAEDDVMIDGKILTGEDDISAREMGRKLVEVLSAAP
jgi:putative intracellular protease/amidase